MTLAVAAKVVLLTLVGLTIASRTEFAGRTTTARVLVYPLIAAGVPVLWFVLRQASRRHVRYPALADALLTLPFAIDLGATLLDLRERHTWWDALAHFTYWTLLTGALAAFLALRPFHPIVLAGLTLGAGCAAAILWEVVEYYTLHASTAERVTEYEGTVHDLALALAASTMAAAVAAVLVSRRVPLPRGSP